MKQSHLIRTTLVAVLTITFMILGFAYSSYAGDHPGSNQKDVVDTAVAAGSFKTLAAALTAADLVGTLKGKGPFTVFAPTDDDLLKPANKAKLQGILTYHVVSGKVMAADVVKLKSAKTVNGQSVTIKVKDGTVMVDNAKVTKTDILCTNGVIHVIDAVILPK